MENIGASVSAVLTPEQKAVEKKIAEEGKKYIRKENEMIFCLEEAPEFQISAVARWGENAYGEVIGQPDIYYRHILTGRLCQCVSACLAGVVHDEYAEEKWDILYYRIRTLLIKDLRRIVLYEKKYEIHPI